MYNFCFYEDSYYKEHYIQNHQVYTPTPRHPEAGQRDNKKTGDQTEGQKSCKYNLFQGNLDLKIDTKHFFLNMNNSDTFLKNRQFYLNKMKIQGP